jgi:acetyltransferase-like isoleucine patch superfamily enzyme
MSIRDITIVRKAVYVWRNWRNKHSYTSGRNNKFINHGGVKVGSRIQIVGNGNKLIMEKGSMLLNSLVKISGNNNEVVLKANSYVSGAELWVENNGCILEIGGGTFVGHHSHLACTEDGSKLIIGGDGMISSYVQVRTGDSHSIVDMEGNRINHPQSVIIGNHCWIGEGAKVLKGVKLEGDDVVSTGAIVTKSFGKNVLLGGIPAKVIKENVTWDKERL